MLSELNDQELMSRYCDGETLAFEELYSRHKGPVYRYLLRQSGNKANAEEVFQEVWIKVIRARDTYRPLAKF
ncbi:MAG: RNA polymerase subunit sigma-24, partial [Gammaproteobacteria bacterium]|nr:RNA polymerase subunit sigma-24 [Gammaproteobacteria bacterium]